MTAVVGNAAANAANAANDYRTNSIRLFQDSVQLTLEEATDLERGIFNWSLQTASDHKIPRNWKNTSFTTLYLDKTRSIYANMKSTSYLENTRLIARMRDGEFVPHEIPFMRPDNLFPERWKEILDEKLRRDEVVFQEKPAAMTNQFKCGRCKKNECIYQELQLRSCDEPVTLFVTCLNCGNRWRMG